jgi:flagellar basal body-associated protein FliL
MLPKDKGLATVYIILIVAAAMLALLASVVFFWHSHSAVKLSSSASAMPTEEQKAYFPRLEITDARMSAAENFLGATVTYLDARVTNKGTKTVSRLDLDLTFVDTLNQVVLRERAHPVTQSTPPLKPGEARAFRVTFEHMPMDWNQAAPAVVPVYVEFE